MSYLPPHAFRAIRSVGSIHGNLTSLCALMLMTVPGVCLHAENPAAATNAPTAILTPEPPAFPRITGASVFGVRPGNPFLFTVSATGARPITFSADHLPPGLTLNPQTGSITGVLGTKGETTVTLHAKNAAGKTARKFRIVVGDTIALTPPLGWNSWNCFANAVDDAKVRAAADAMVSSGLINHGWTYINIDDCWEGDRDSNGVIQSNQKFPNMKALSDYIHSKGLKFGIYSSPGPRTCAGFTASYQHEDQDARRYADWGVDYVKYDWCSYDGVARDRTATRYTDAIAEGSHLAALNREEEKLSSCANPTAEEKNRLTQVRQEISTLAAKISPDEKARIDLEILQEPYARFRSSLDKVPRDIVFSFCQYGMGDVWKWGQKTGGNSWRTTGDITDSWESLSGIGFNQAGHEVYAGPGHWNDPDMLIVGKVGWGPQLHPTRLTPDEQYTHISLWSLLSAPLLIGCDMSQLDDFTKGLLSNDEVLAVSQDPLGKQASRVSVRGDLQVWAKDLQDGSKAVGLFNLGGGKATVTADWKDLGLNGDRDVRDLWRQKDLGSFNDKYEASVPSHGVVLVKISPETK